MDAPEPEFIERDTFKGLPKLESLVIDHCSVSTFEEGAFGHLTNLKELSITNCKLTKCPPLTELKNVETLGLAGNEIKTVNDLFTGMENDKFNLNLRKLNLQSNCLSLTSDANCFYRLAGLTTLRLDNNGISEIPAGAFGGLVNLRALHLGGNFIQTLDLNNLFHPSLVNLRYVDFFPGELAPNDECPVSEIISTGEARALFKRYRYQVQAWVIAPIIIAFQLKSITIIMVMVMPLTVFRKAKNNGNGNWSA